MSDQVRIQLLICLCVSACADRVQAPGAESSSGESGGHETTTTDDSTVTTGDAGCRESDQLTCNFEGAWDLSVGETAVYWVAGSNSPTCAAGAPCGTPRLEALESGEDSPTIITELESTPSFVELVGPEESIIVGTDSGLVHVEPNGATEIIAAHRVGGLAAIGDALFWVDVTGSVIQQLDWLTGPEQAPTPIVQLEERNVLAFAAGPQALVWADYPPMSTANGRIRAYDIFGSSSSTVAEDPGLVTTLAVVGDDVYWVDTLGSVLTSPLDGSGGPTKFEVEAAEGATSFVGADNRLFFGWLDLTSEEAGVSVLEVESGDATQFLLSDYVVGDRAPTVWQVRDGLLYWSSDMLYATAID